MLIIIIVIVIAIYGIDMVEAGKQAKFGFTFERKPNNDIYLTPVAEHKYTVLWMHGLGDSSDGFLDFFYTANSILPNQVRTEDVGLIYIYILIEHQSHIAQCS